MYLTDRKVAVLGAAGAIGSNVVQDLLSTGTACRIAMYDPFGQALEGAAQEIYHCGYPGASVTWTTDLADALNGATYIITSGGAPRREGMTREDLLRGNCEIARDLGVAIRMHAPAAELVIVIFNPADITGLAVLVHSGLRPGYVTTLAALDSTRLQTALAAHFALPQDAVTGCATYGGHGEKMAVVKRGIQIDGVPLTDVLAGADVNGIGMTVRAWSSVQDAVRQGGSAVIKLRGRSSFQSPAHQSVEMLRARILRSAYPWPCGVYFGQGDYRGVMMAGDAAFTPTGLHGSIPDMDADDRAQLADSYRHICALRDEVIAAGLIPPVGEWSATNPYLK